MNFLQSITNRVFHPQIKNVPSLERIASQCCTANQFEESLYNFWLKEINQEHRYHRKQWEYIYILQALNEFGFLKDGKSGIGFGCGKEPLPAVMAKYGCNVLVTDIEPLEKSDSYWGAHSASDVFYPGICSEETFLSHVTFQHADMNNIPVDLMDGSYDFVWSCCALEHLGSLKAGLDFILHSAGCLKPGGIAVHTTEYNVNEKRKTLESPGLSLYRKQDLERLSIDLGKAGFSVLPFNWYTGNLPQDQYVDLPPYKQETHLKLQIDKYVVTSFGLIVTRK